MRVQVHLHGAFEDLHDGPVEIEAVTGAEVCAALINLFPDILSHPAAGSAALVTKDGSFSVDRAITPDNSGLPLSDSEVHLVAAPSGSAEVFIYIAISILTSVVMRLLFPPPDIELADEGPDSFYFATSTTAKQGKPVPLVYGGPILVPGLAISASLEVSDTSTTTTVTDTDNLLGYEYPSSGSDAYMSTPQPVYGTKEVYDWLRSETSLTTLEVVSEGEIEGLATVDPGESVYLNDSPLRSGGEDVVSNVRHALVPGSSYEGITDDLATLSIPAWSRGFRATSSANLGFVVKKGAPISSTVTEDVDHLAVMLQFPAGLMYQNNSGNPTRTAVEAQIDISADGGPFEPVRFYNDDGTYSTPPVRIKGRTTSTYQRRILIEKAQEYGPPPYVVRVSRNTANRDSLRYVDTMEFSSIQSVFDDKILYPNTAMATVSVNAETFDNQAPTRKYLVKGIKVLVPTNYDPVARTYSGIWNGTFKRAWTNNPAWIAYDLISNKRYGAGRRVPQRTLDTVKWHLYSISQYCDQPVDDGVGGTEPRFTMSMRITDSKEAVKTIRDIFSVFRGRAAWHASGLIALADIPSDPVYVYNQTNVIGGKFTYSGGAKSERLTAVLVSWMDPAKNYQKAVEYVPDSVGIRESGLVQKTAVAVGATTRGQAMRAGRAMLISSLLEGEVVTFKTKLEGLRAAPGSVVKIHDPHATGISAGGRVLQATASTFHPDREVVIELGKTYTLTLLDSSGHVREDLTITSPTGLYGPDNTASLSFAPALSSAPLDDSLWMIQSDDAADGDMTSLWRVVSIKEEGKGTKVEYQVEATRYDPDKYTQIENGLDTHDYHLPEGQQDPVPPPTDVALTTGWKTLAGGGRVQTLTLSFTPSPYPHLTHHKVLMTSPAGETSVDILSKGVSTFTLSEPELGEYVAVVTAHGPSEDGLQILKSVPVVVSVDVTPTTEGSWAYVTGLALVGQATGTEFIGPDAEFQWRLSGQGGNDLAGSESPTEPAWFKGFRVEIYDASSNIRRVESTRAGHYSYTLAKNKEDGTPIRELRISVAAEDNTGTVVGEWSSLQVTNPAPAAPSVTTWPAFSQIVVSLGRPVDNDYSHLEVHYSQTPGFTPGPASLYAAGDLSTVTLAGLSAGTTYYLRTRAVDQFGPGGLSTEVGVTTQAITSADLDVVAPVLGGVLTLSTLLMVAGPETHPYIKASWPAATDDGILSGYIIEWWNQSTPLDARQEFTTGLEVNIGPVTPGQTYVLRYKARDWASNDSSWSANSQIVSAGDTTPPANVTNAAAVAGLRKVVVTWTSPSEDKYREAQVYASPVNTPPVGQTYLRYSGRGSSAIIEDMTPGTQVYIFVRTLSKFGIPSSWTTGMAVTPFKLSDTNVSAYFESAAISSAFIGNLDAAKITTGTLNAGRIGAGTIDASKLNVTSLSAISATLGTVTSGIITGSVLRTAASGQPRVEINSFGIRGFNSATTVTTYRFDTAGSGFIGLNNAISWDTNGVLTIPGTVVAGEIIGNMIKTAETGWRVEIGPVADGTNPAILASLTDGITRNFTMREDGSVEIGTQLVGSGAGQLYRNLIDPSTWNLGDVDVDQVGFKNKGSTATSTNSIVALSGPNGEHRVTWKVDSHNVLDGQGGWDGSDFPIDPNKAYRFSVIFSKTGNMSGRVYLGVGFYSNTRRIVDDVVDPNPYLWSGKQSLSTWMQPGRHYLIVGHVYPSATTETVIDDTTGVYDVETGEKMEGIVAPAGGGYFLQLKWDPAADKTFHRAYVYYATEGDHTHFLDPRVDVMDGTAPSVQELMGASRNWIDVGGRPRNFVVRSSLFSRSSQIFGRSKGWTPPNSVWRAYRP